MKINDSLLNGVQEAGSSNLLTQTLGALKIKAPKFFALSQKMPKTPPKTQKIRATTDTTTDIFWGIFALKNG